VNSDPKSSKNRAMTNSISVLVFSVMFLFSVLTSSSDFWLVRSFVDDTPVSTHVLFDVTQHIFRILAPEIVDRCPTKWFLEDRTEQMSPGLSSACPLLCG
jgi:isoprenylcysteine carboxyl methyltransferase (ICMT) family protein YpbQ